MAEASPAEDGSVGVNPGLGPVDYPELGGFLRACRARLRPEDVGLASLGPERRVPGLRRNEVAQLANLSISYYIRIEQGQAGAVSAEILSALARALRLDADERAHLDDLSRAAQIRSRHTPAQTTPSQEATDAARQMIEHIQTPAYVLGSCDDVLAWNRAGHLFYKPQFPFSCLDRPADRPNTMRSLFLEPEYRDAVVDWENAAKEATSHLRMTAGRFKNDPYIANFIDDLSQRSPEFRAFWAEGPVRRYLSATSGFRHPGFGSLILNRLYVAELDLPEQKIMIVSAEAGSASHAALTALSSEPRSS